MDKTKNKKVRKIRKENNEACEVCRKVAKIGPVNRFFEPNQMDCQESIEIDKNKRTEVEPKEEIVDDKALMPCLYKIE